MNCLNSLKSLNSLKNLSSFSYNKKLFSTLTSSTNLTSTANYLSSKGDLQLHYDIITEEQEKTLLKVLNNLLVKRRYEKNHWDSVINHYKEIELNYKEEEFSSLSSLHEETKKILLFIEEFIHQHVDSEGKMKILPPHVIDIRKDGNIGKYFFFFLIQSGNLFFSLSFYIYFLYILLKNKNYFNFIYNFLGAHVDSIKFSGCLISGLSLNCERIMKLTKVDPSELPYGK